MNMQMIVYMADCMPMLYLTSVYTAIVLLVNFVDFIKVFQPFEK